MKSILSIALVMGLLFGTDAHALAAWTCGCGCCADGNCCEADGNCYKYVNRLGYILTKQAK